MLPDRVREAFAWMETVVAIPPAGSVEVECELVRRLYSTREWDATRAMLTDDFALIGSGGSRAGLDELKRTNELMADAYEDLRAEIESIVADPLAIPCGHIAGERRVAHYKIHCRLIERLSGNRLKGSPQRIEAEAGAVQFAVVEEPAKL